MQLRNQFPSITSFLVALGVMTCFGLICEVLAQDKGRTATQQSHLLAENQELSANEQLPYSAPQPLDCESFAVLLDNARVEWQQAPGTHLIFIVRFGEGESGGDLSRTRLKDLDDYMKRDKTMRYVTGEGRRVKGLAKLELYVGGKLRTVIPIKKNYKHVCLGKVNPFL